MAIIQKVGNYLILFGDDNHVLASREIPISGKTLIIRVQLSNIASAYGVKARSL